MISAHVIVRSVKMGSVITVHAKIVLAPIATVKIGGVWNYKLEAELSKSAK